VVGGVERNADKKSRYGKHEDTYNDVHLELSDVVDAPLYLAMQQKDA